MNAEEGSARTSHCERTLDFRGSYNFFATSITAGLLAETPIPFYEYPPAQATQLTKMAAKHYAVDPDWLVLGCGLEELIWFTLMRLAPAKALLVGPVPYEYVAACTALDIPHEILTPSEENCFIPEACDYERLWRSDADLVIICSPNFPAGAALDNIPALLQMIRAPRILLDNRFLDCLSGTHSHTEGQYISCLAHVRPGGALYSLCSFGPLYACPGIGIACLISDRIPLNRLAQFRPSGMITPFAAAVGEQLLKQKSSYEESLPGLRAAVAHLARELRRTGCFAPEMVFEGACTVTASLHSGRPSGAVTTALQQQQILITDCSGIPGMPPSFIRMQARPEEDTEKLLKALQYLA